MCNISVSCATTALFFHAVNSLVNFGDGVIRNILPCRHFALNLNISIVRFAHSPSN